MKPFTICFLLLSSVALSAADGPRTFATPQEAAQALKEAAGKSDSAALLALLGPAGKSIVESGDPAEDQSGRQKFTTAASEKLTIEQDSTNPNRATIVVGEREWPFPVPLVRKDGKWQFDSAKGRVEILARRIGKNELSAVEVCRGYVEAQMEYASHDRATDGMLQYAQKII